VKLHNLVRTFKGASRFIANPFKERRRQHRLQKLEAERIDRICNPAKYRMK